MTSAQPKTLSVADASRRPVCITGIGAITPFALGWAEVFNHINRETPAYEAWNEDLDRPFDAAKLGLVRTVPKERYFDERQLRLMDRAMTLASVASAFAMEDAGILVDDEVRGADDLATVLASSQGELPSLYRFGIPLFKPGPKTGTLNPAQFPMIARNIACGQVALRFGLRGWSTMIASGDASGSQALARATEMVALGRADRVLVGAYEVLAQFSLHQLKARWKKQGLQEVVAHCESNHHVPVEGACFFVLESESHAAERGRTPYAVISHATQGYRLDDNEASWNPVLDRHLRKAPVQASSVPLHIRAGQPFGAQHQREGGLRDAVVGRHGCAQEIDARADFGDAGAVTAMYQAALAAQLLSPAAHTRAEAENGRYAPAKAAVLSAMTRSGAYSLLSMHAS
jgi:3-oxoacyl-[acyl-carrier-protein] synthase II